MRIFIVFKAKFIFILFQMQAIPLLLDKRQVLVCAPTGSGKTAAYLVPLLHLLSQKKREETKKKSISAVIVAPTRELVRLSP
jgi:superfamily II DNA/RNA helicase